MKGNFVVLISLLFCGGNLLATSEKNYSAFVPSSEWQLVAKGQPIPSGLHVRHNFKTGVTEAKLLDEESEKDSEVGGEKSLTLHPEKSIPQSDKDNGMDGNETKLSLDELKARLKKIKLLDDEIEADDQQSRIAAQERFKSYTNLKNEWKALEVNITTDSEMMVEFFQRFSVHRDSLAMESITISVTNDILQILNNLEYLLHQIDNAHTFSDMGGMVKIILPCLNGTNDEIKTEALKLLGTAVQSNPKVQAKALEHDFVQKLLHILATTNKNTIQSRCLFALSALIRGLPAAQKALIDHGGLEILGKILEDGHLQIQSRIIKLISDLVVERNHLGNVEDDDLRKRKIEEYAKTDFDEKLLIHNYCKHMRNLMIKSFSNEAFGDSNVLDYEFLGVTLDSMILLSSICKRDFHAEKHSILAIINEALRHYESVGDARPTSEDDYSYSHLVSLLIKLRTELGTFELPREEL